MTRFEQEQVELQQVVMSYVDEIKTGKVPAGQKMKWAVDRFLKDLKDTNKKDSKYYIDWFELMKFYRWAKMFKHTKGILANQPIELHESQLFEAANIFCFKHRSDGSRRFREVYIKKARKNAIYLASVTGM